MRTILLIDGEYEGYIEYFLEGDTLDYNGIIYHNTGKKDIFDRELWSCKDK